MSTDNKIYNSSRSFSQRMMLLPILAFSFLVSCKRLVEVPAPITVQVKTNVFSNDATASSVMLGIYSNMANGAGQFAGEIGLLSGLSADELTKYSNDATLSQFYQNSLKSNNVLFWKELYKYIYTCNSVLENLPNANVTPAVSQQLIGEAKFMRAFFYFYLVNLWGDVPLLLSTDYQRNAVASRTAQSLVYEQIVADLKDAENLMSSDYLGADALNPSVSRLRPTKLVAAALLARVYLYTKDWIDAEAQASEVINASSAFNLVSDLSQVFLKDSREAIWQLSPVQPNYNTYDAFYYILEAVPGPGFKSVALSPFLYNSFEENDNRKSQWIGTYSSGGSNYYYAYKYRIGSGTSAVSEYLMVLRLAEQYLIRSEARAQQGKVLGANSAESDLNAIRNRAGLSNTTASSQSDMLTAIYHERQAELFTEWGHRWLDLKRSGSIDAVMGVPGGICQAKGGSWNIDWQLYPIPISEILIDNHLTQNDGYQ